MARSKRLEIVIAGDASGGVRALGTIEGRLGRAGRSFGRFGRAAAIGMGAIAVAGAAAVVAVGRDLVNMERLNAQTATAIRSSGNAANVTVDDINALTQSIQDLSGIQAESVQEGSNLLLTFHNIRNAAGEGNDIFNQATEAMVDMSVAMGTDASSEAIRLGRALNDPIAGMQALTRVGIQFDDRQREWIEHLVESGDVMGAQKVILAELNAEFGGSAAAFGETTAGQFARAKEQLGDLAESIVVRLMPALTTAIDWFRSEAIPALEDFADWVGPRLTAAFNTAVAWVRTNWPQIQTTITDVLTRVREVVTSVVEFIRTAWAAFGDDIIGHVRRAWPIVQQTITGVMNVIKGVINTVGAIIRGDWGAIWDGIVQILRGAWQLIVATIRTSINTARSLIGVAWQVIRNLTSSAWEGIKTAVRNGIDGVMGFIRGLPGRIGSALSGLGDLLVNAGRAIIQGLWDGMQDMWDQVTGWLSNLNPANWFNDINLRLGHAEVNLLPTGRAVMGGLGEGMAEGWDTNRRWLSTINPAAAMATGPTVTSTSSASVVVNVTVNGDADAQAVRAIEAGVRRGLSTPQLDRKIRRLAGAR